MDDGRAAVQGPRLPIQVQCLIKDALTFEGARDQNVILMMLFYPVLDFNIPPVSPSVCLFLSLYCMYFLSGSATQQTDIPVKE